MKRRLLDLFCCAGGAAEGYTRAGFDVVGVDHAPQSRYPFAFCEADAPDFLRGLLAGASVCGYYLTDFDAIHASPPCQRWSIGNRPHRSADRHPELIAPVRELLVASGLPWVIENVVGAPLRRPILLCGRMFGLRVYRHRLFESSQLLLGPSHPAHRESTGSHRGYSYRHAFVCVAGHNFNREEGAAAMGIDWMGSRRELAQAIPPPYTEYLGRQLLAQLES